MLSPEVEAIIGLLSIHLYFQKLSGRFQLRMHILPLNHVIKSLLESRHTKSSPTYQFSLKRLISRQQLVLKEHIVDANNRLNRVFPSFDSLCSEFSPGDRLIDIFASHIYFHSMDRKNKENRKAHICKLNTIIFKTFKDSRTSVIVSDTSIKNQVAILIAHIYTHNSLVVKTIYYTVNVMSTEAKLFAIRCGINKATSISNINQIIIITDLLHTAKRIFNSSIHPYQSQSFLILRELREFLIKDQNNSIEF